MQETHRMIWPMAGLLALICLLGCFVYLTIIFPHTMLAWEASGEALSATQKWLVALSQFCGRNFADIVVTLCMLMLGMGLWIGVMMKGWIGGR
ncbi:MAG: hypothetical protein CL920_24925 [Deltaproteobacteria bacterium]|nr:hypothetical protein [Deltaproteobacteria bacterium]